MPDDNDQLDPIQTAVPLASQTHPAATQAVAQQLVNLRDLPARMIAASEGLRTTGQYDPGPSVELMQLLMGGGMPAAERYALGAAGGRMKTAVRPVGEFAQYAEHYPPVGPPKMEIDPKKGTLYPAKQLTPEAEKFRSAREKIKAQMEKEGYTPYFDPAQRFYPDPKNYPPNVATGKITPAKQETIDKHLAVIGSEETRQRLRKAYSLGLEDLDSQHWYAVGQLEKAFVDQLGPAAGRKAFRDRFAAAMASTTAGATPETNLMVAHYLNYLRTRGLPYPTAAHEAPYPAGGRRFMPNVEAYIKTMEGGGFPALGKANPKRHNFAQNFMGNLGVGTIDEQMIAGMTPKMPLAPGQQYGLYEQVLGEEAARGGNLPANYQDVAWAGFKKMKESGYKAKPMIAEINDAIERTHRLTGMARDEIVRRGLIKGEIPLYGAGGLAAAGAAAAPSTSSNQDPQ